MKSLDPGRKTYVTSFVLYSEKDMKVEGTGSGLGQEGDGAGGGGAKEGSGG